MFLTLPRQVRAQNVARTWATLGLNLVEHKGAYKVRNAVHSELSVALSSSDTSDDPFLVQIRSADDVFCALEDSSVALSAMKASHFTDFFQADITRWERTLASVSETLELVLQVLSA